MPCFILIPMTWQDRYWNFISLTLIEVEFLGRRPLLFQTVCGEKFSKSYWLSKCGIDDCLESNRSCGEELCGILILQGDKQELQSLGCLFHFLVFTVNLVSVTYETGFCR